MTNMSYCRFHNTLEDLEEAYDHMDDDDLSDAEKAARHELIKLCGAIEGDYGQEIDDEDDETGGGYY